MWISFDTPQIKSEKWYLRCIGEYVIVVTDIDNQINFNDDLDIYQSLPVFHAVHLYAGVSNPKAKKGGGGKGKKKKKKK